MPRQTFPEGCLKGWKLYISGKNYYLRNTNNWVAHIPQYVVDTLEGKEQVTYIIGPFVFVNGFEETTEGKYLCKIFPHYFNMTPRAEEKVNKIMERYGWWVRLHKEYIAEMIHKEYTTEMKRRKTK